MNYEEQRMAFWREALIFAAGKRGELGFAPTDFADVTLDEFDKRFAPKIDPLPELTK